MLRRKILLPALLVTGLIVAAVVTGGVNKLSYGPSTPSLHGALSSFNTASYSSCSTHHSGPCLAKLDPSDYSAKANRSGQMCSWSEFSGYPFGSNGNVNGSGKTTEDAWLFVVDPVNFYQIQLNFGSHTVSFSTSAPPPSPQTNSANVYYTQNYSHVAVLTPPGWTLTGGTGLVSGLPNSSNTFQLSHTCAGGSPMHNYDRHHRPCDYPSNPSQIYGSKSSYGSSWQISGGINDNRCHIPGQKIHCSGHNFSSYVTTDADGHFDLTGIPRSAFPLTFTYPGSPNSGWPSALSFTVT